MNALIIAWTTCATKEDADKLAKALLNSELVACVHVEGPVSAHYVWDGKIENSEEYKLTIKAPKRHTSLLTEWIKKNHPYTTPQWIAIDIDHILPAYADWVIKSTS